MANPVLLREKSRPGRSGSVRNLISIVIGLVLLGWLLTQVDLRAMLSMLAQTRLEWFLVGCTAYLISSLARAYRFVRLTHLPLRRIRGMLTVVLAMSLANQILPARLGELSYVYLARKSENLPVGKGLVSLLLARLLDLLSIGLLFVIGSVSALKQLPSETLIYVWAAIGSMALVVGMIVVLVVWRRPLCTLAGHLLERTLLARLPGRYKLVRLVRDVEASLETMSGPLQYFDFLQSSLLVWLGNFGVLYVLLLSLDILITPGQMVIGATFAALTSVLPINSIGSFGTLEAGWTAGFVLVGMDADLALTTGFATHLLALSYAVAFGLLAWGWVLWNGRKSDANAASL